MPRAGPQRPHHGPKDHGGIFLPADMVAAGGHPGASGRHRRFDGRGRLELCAAPATDPHKAKRPTAKEAPGDEPLTISLRSELAMCAAWRHGAQGEIGPTIALASW